MAQIQTLISSFRSFFYPPYCWNCGEGVSSPQNFLCEGCLPLLELQELEERCPTCFSKEYCMKMRRCRQCHYKMGSAIYRFASAFSHEGPAEKIIRKLKMEGKNSIAKLCASYLVMQMERLGWPIPDLFVPVPVSRFVYWQRGFNSSELLAQNLGLLFHRPVEHLLFRNAGGFPQDKLDMEQRRLLAKGVFGLRGIKKSYADQTILLIDDLKITGMTLERCAEALLEIHPSRIYAISFTSSN